MQFLRQATQVAVMIGPFLDATDGKTPETGLSLTQSDIRVSRVTDPGGVALPFASKGLGAAPVHAEGGYYTFDVSSVSDTGNRGRLIISVNVAGALPVWHEYTVLSANVFDSLITATDNLNVEMVSSGTGAITSGTFASSSITGSAVASNAIDTNAFANNALDAVHVTTAFANKIADHVLRRTTTLAENSANGDALQIRSLLGAVAKLVHKVTIVGNTLSVFEADATTVLGTQTTTTDGNAFPITEVETDGVP